MPVLSRRLVLLVIAAVVFFTTVPIYAHNLPVGSSRWCFGKKTIVANIDLGATLLSELQGIKDGKYNLNSSTDEELQQIAANVLQPYLNRKLSITVNEKNYPVKVDRLVRDNNLFTIWLSVDNVIYKNSANAVKIDYRLLFDETDNTHLNLAYMYFSDASGDALKNIFDFSQPAGHFSFDYKTTAWEVSVKGSATEAASEQKKDAKVNSDIAAVNSQLKSIEKDSNHLLPNGSALPAPDSAPVVLPKMQPKVSAPPPTPGSLAANSPAGAGENRVIGNNPAKSSTWSTITQFLLLGIEHILTGYDHIAFLVALIVIGLSIREVLKIITAFTVAHSITLLLAALQIVSLNSRFVESAIALSICYVALENLFRKKIKYRWLVTFGFGLIHGFGFASALQELIVGKANLVLSVLSFNLGVEAGQVMIFILLLPILHFLKNKLEPRMITVGASMAVFALGFTWLVERVFDLKLLPI